MPERRGGRGSAPGGRSPKRGTGNKKTAKKGAARKGVARKGGQKRSGARKGGAKKRSKKKANSPRGSKRMSGKKATPERGRETPPHVEVTTWWAREWISALERLGEDFANRLPRGRSYAENEGVVEFSTSPGRVEARVLGTFEPFYEVEVELPPIPADKWDKVFTELGSNLAHAAPLLSGTIPEDIDEAFQKFGVSLFPKTLEELSNTCTCADFAERSTKAPHFICKHIAAVHYVLADIFEADPFILFEIRGASREKVLSGIGEKSTIPGVSRASGGEGGAETEAGTRSGAGAGTRSGTGTGATPPDLSVHGFFNSPRREVPSFRVDPPAGDNPLFSERNLPTSLKNPVYFRRVLSKALERAARWAHETATGTTQATRNGKNAKR
ncbi:MAG: hypothetical protein ACTSU5_16740 [Promethearchaeota archaeon]